ncbi:hypothetical protein B0H63DRAFT_473016 [Podospora didyma]|uniref:Uncharacterized protein n=1 Tax=Podospora didyma TaxID=330526 RepID=A0AAE0NPW4_9PEZI|nr:hypothetical protein B0H63DRAFT_473016 [Podospora didyma]
MTSSRKRRWLFSFFFFFAAKHFQPVLLGQFIVSSFPASSFVRSRPLSGTVNEKPGLCVHVCSRPHFLPIAQQKSHSEGIPEQFHSMFHASGLFGTEVIAAPWSRLNIAPVGLAKGPSIWPMSLFEINNWTVRRYEAARLVTRRAQFFFLPFKNLSSAVNFLL